MTNKWLDDFSRRVGDEISTAIKLASSMAHKMNQDFIEPFSRLNMICAKIGIFISCASAIGIIDVLHIVALFTHPTRSVVLGALAVSFSLFSFGAGLLLASILHHDFIHFKGRAQSFGPRPGSNPEI